MQGWMDARAFGTHGVTASTPLYRAETVTFQRTTCAQLFRTYRIVMKTTTCIGTALVGICRLPYMRHCTTFAPSVFLVFKSRSREPLKP